MQVRMTSIGAITATFLAGAAAGGALAAGDNADSPRTALVIDAAVARDGRELVDDRLRATGVELRVPRTAAEARTNVRYLAAADYRLVVAGPQASAAADAAKVDALRARDRAAALAAVER
jgi:hypothetical protein